MSVLTIARHYKLRPSQIINIDNDYEAFCFDEACAFIINEINSEKEPRFENEEKTNNNDDIIKFFNENN